MKNLIFFDVDGTLITKCNNEFIIPQRNLTGQTHK